MLPLVAKPFAITNHLLSMVHHSIIQEVNGMSFKILDLSINFLFSSDFYAHNLLTDCFLIFGIFCKNEFVSKTLFGIASVKNRLTALDLQRS